MGAMVEIAQRQKTHSARSVHKNLSGMVHDKNTAVLSLEKMVGIARANK